MPEFAVEFDGSQHKYDKDAISNDKLKNSICRKLDFSLLRITSEYFEKIGRFPAILSWIIELYFIRKAFEIAQSEGQIPQDESWLWFSVYGYDPVDDYRAVIEYYNKGLGCDDVIESISGSSNNKKSYTTLSILKINDNEYLANYVECSTINFFAISASDISRKIADYYVMKQFKKYIEGNHIRTYTHAEILKMKKDSLKQHGSFLLKLGK